MFGMLNVLSGIVQLFIGILMLILAIAFGIEHPVPGALALLFLLVFVIFPIWATLRKSYLKEARRQQSLRATVRMEQALRAAHAHQAARRRI